MNRPIETLSAKYYRVRLEFGYWIVKIYDTDISFMRTSEKFKYIQQAEQYAKDSGLTDLDRLTC